MSTELQTAESQLPAATSASEVIGSAREVAEIQSMITVAKKFPRDQIQSIDRIMVACSRETLAKSAMYEYPRGKTKVTGPSIRLAEAIAQNWGNVQFGIREIEQIDGESTVEAYAWDMETNSRSSKSFKVKHIRSTRSGSYALTDPRDIYEKVANDGARRLRSCIMAVIPGYVFDEAVDVCQKTLVSKVDVTPELLKKVLDQFKKYSITKQQIEDKFQMKFDKLTPRVMVELGKIYNSLEDGMSKPIDWFTPEKQGEEEEKTEGKSKSDDLAGKI